MNDVGEEGIRADRLLVYLRFARTRSAACGMIDAHALRCNRKHVRRASEQICIGDVLTIVVGTKVRVLELIALPARRASADLAKTFYNDITASTRTDTDALTKETKSP